MLTTGKELIVNAADGKFTIEVPKGLRTDSVDVVEMDW